jgi:thymidylate kinase
MARAFPASGVDRLAVQRPSSGHALPPAESSQTDGSLLDAVDACLDRPVIVTSSGGRDIDLLCRAPERDRLRSLLRARGYRPSGRLARRAWTEQWVRITGGAVNGVDLNPAERWGLDDATVEELFDRAEPAGGRSMVRRAAPEHALILLARRHGRNGGPLPARQRAKVERALGDAGEAVWTRAAALAPAWGAARSLANLKRRHAGTAPGRVSRALAAAETTRCGRRPGARLARTLWAAAPQRPLVVAFSGLDGSGKSTQVSALRETLDAAGIASRIAWRPVGHGRAVQLVRRAGKRAMGRPHRRVSPAQGAPALTWEPDPITRRLRERSASLTAVWAAYVAVATAASYRRAQLAAAFRRQSVLVCDRHALDTDVHLLFQYGGRRRPALAIALSDAVMPRADAAFLIELPAAEARARKPLQYREVEAERLAALYHGEASRLGVSRLSGLAPPGRLAETIAHHVWTVAGER